MNERKVLKVPSQNTTETNMGDEDKIPHMGSEDDMNNNIPFEDYENSIVQGDDINSDFDTNFDAGVEADEETDPKKYIQQLTGKLSQTLNSYNNENGEPDVELGKYVLGMLVKQGTKGMGENDRKEIIKKINTNNTVDSVENLDTDTENNDYDENIQTESKKIKCTKKQLFESFGIAMSDENQTLSSKESDTKISNDTVRSRRTRPFEAPKKFKE